MVKNRIGKAKMEKAKQQRLDRGRVKMERKRERHDNCSVFFATGRHKPELDTNYCDECQRPFKLWF
jgi:cyclophilin family peptidyl-prolyl cis-trans isomerase